MREGKKIDKAIDLLLDSAWWPDSLTTSDGYVRVQDDCDGDQGQILAVSFSADADAWIKTYHYGTLRFRSEFGGGMSPRVRNALILLAEAIRRDNADRPQRRVQP
jgi:hypothetical protein